MIGIVKDTVLSIVYMPDVLFNLCPIDLRKLNDVGTHASYTES